MLGSLWPPWDYTGSQYSASNFKALVARHEALQSMSRRGNCYDNAHAESVWSRLKTELLDGGSFPGLPQHDWKSPGTLPVTRLKDHSPRSVTNRLIT